ncbi:MAG: CbtA family protein [Pseudonocardiaceae bacterium]
MSTFSAQPRTETTAVPFAVVLRAALVGAAAAGLVGAAVSALLVEIPIRSALAVENSRTAASAESAPGHRHSEEMFDRSTQVIGGMLAAVLVALVLGVVLAVVFARLRNFLPGRTDFGRAVAVATAGFVVVSLLPGIKYPANPPAVGDPDTVNTRTLYYLSFLAAAIVLTLAVLALRRRLPAHWPASWTSTVSVLLVVTGYALLVAWWPASPDDIPADVPARLIWQFRLSSLAELAALWATLGIVTGLVLERRLGSRGEVAAVP